MGNNRPGSLVARSQRLRPSGAATPCRRHRSLLHLTPRLAKDTRHAYMAPPPFRPRIQPTILIVDDEKHTREGLRASLEDSFDVYIAASGNEARAVLDREHVDLVLTDLRLGGEDGMALIDEMLKRPDP